MSKVTCYSEFVSALSVVLVSLCPYPLGLNYFVMAALKCRNSLQFSGFHLSSCSGAVAVLPSSRRFSEQGSASSSLGAVRLTVLGCDAIVGSDFHGESFKITPVDLRPARDWSTSATFPFNCPTAPSARF